MRLVFFGDSITDGKRDRENDFINTSYGNGYVRDIVADLFSIDPNGYEVINRGISGNRIVDLYARIKMDLWNLNPDVISILVGINDIWHEVKYQNGVDIVRYEKIYRILIEDTIKVLPKAKIILLEPFVLEGNRTNDELEKFLVVKEYAKVVKKLADEFNLPFVPLQEKLEELAKVHGADKCLIDGIHPAVFGARTIATEWMKTFKKL